MLARLVPAASVARTTKECAGRFTLTLLSAMREPGRPISRLTRGSVYTQSIDMLQGNFSLHGGPCDRTLNDGSGRSGAMHRRIAHPVSEQAKRPIHSGKNARCPCAYPRSVLCCLNIFPRLDVTFTLGSTPLVYFAPSPSSDFWMIRSTT